MVTTADTHVVARLNKCGINENKYQILLCMFEIDKNVRMDVKILDP